MTSNAPVQLVPASEATYKTVGELAAKFKISKTTVYRMCRTDGPDRWPCGRVGTGPNARIRFSPAQEAEIEQILHGSKQHASAPQLVDPAALKRAGRRLLKAKAQPQRLAA